MRFVSASHTSWLQAFWFRCVGERTHDVRVEPDERPADLHRGDASVFVPPPDRVRRHLPCRREVVDSPKFGFVQMCAHDAPTFVCCPDRASSAATALRTIEPSDLSSAFASTRRPSLISTGTSKYTGTCPFLSRRCFRSAYGMIPHSFRLLHFELLVKALVVQDTTTSCGVRANGTTCSGFTGPCAIEGYTGQTTAPRPLAALTTPKNGIPRTYTDGSFRRGR